MKSFLFVLIWTTLFVGGGIFIEYDLNRFVNTYENKIDIVEKYIVNDDYDKAKQEVISISKALNNNKDKWYKLIDHEHYNEILFSLEVLEDDSTLEDQSIHLEYINRIRYCFDNILHLETCDLNHIF